MNQRKYTSVALELPEQDYISLCQAIIQKNSKSFAFASRYNAKKKNDAKYQQGT